MAQKHILVAEDDNVLRGILLDKLTESGYKATGAEDGEAALQVVKKNIPDLILLDIVMPKKDGMQVLEELHKNAEYSKIPVMVISNSGQPLEIERARELGAKDFLVKAVFDPKEVLEKVNVALGGPGTSTATPKETGTSSSTVLVVEDDKFLRELLLEKLLGSNISVVGAMDGKEAFKLLETLHPAVILLDIILPDINGFEILQKIRANKNMADVPVLILSNLDQKEDMDRAHALGANGFMIKSNFSLTEIVTKVQGIIGKK